MSAVKLLHIPSQQLLDAEIIRVTDHQLLERLTLNQFEFNWTSLSHHILYQIHLADRKTPPLGLMALADYPKEARIHIHLIETVKQQRGQYKTVRPIAACLIAYAVKIAFLKGYGGFVSLLPKTQLLDYYISQYGFAPYGRHLAIEGNTAYTLILKYLSHG